MDDFSDFEIIFEHFSMLIFLPVVIFFPVE